MRLVPVLFVASLAMTVPAAAQIDLPGGPTYGATSEQVFATRRAFEAATTAEAFCRATRDVLHLNIARPGALTMVPDAGEIETRFAPRDRLAVHACIQVLEAQETRDWAWMMRDRLDHLAIIPVPQDPASLRQVFGVLEIGPELDRRAEAQPALGWLLDSVVVRALAVVPRYAEAFARLGIGDPVVGLARIPARTVPRPAIGTPDSPIATLDDWCQVQSVLQGPPLAPPAEIAIPPDAAAEAAAQPDVAAALRYCTGAIRNAPRNLGATRIEWLDRRSPRRR